MQLEQNESTGGTTVSGGRRKRKLHASVTGAVIGGFLLLDFLHPWLNRLGLEWVTWWMVGTVIAQLNLIAVWAALAPGNIVLRVPWSASLAVLLWYALVLGKRVDGAFPSVRSMTSGEALFLGALLLVGFVATQIPMWIVGRVFRWRLSVEGETTSKIDRKQTQFGLRQLFLGILLFALVLGPLRLVLPTEAGWGLSARPDMAELIGVLTMAAVCNLLITVPCVGGVMLRMPQLLVVGLAWFPYCAILTVAEIVVFVMLVGPPMMTEQHFFAILYSLNISQFVTVFGTLLVFRALGYRMQRAARTPTSRGKRNGRAPLPRIVIPAPKDAAQASDPVDEQS